MRKLMALILLAGSGMGCVGTNSLFQPTATYAIPLRALGYDADGNLVIHSSRNATLGYNETGADGSQKTLNFAGDSSGVIGAQAAAVSAIESQRFAFIGDRLDRLESLISSVLAQRASAPSPPNAGPSRLDRLEAIVERLLAETGGGE